MRQLAMFASAEGGRVLEIGYGLGMCSAFIQEIGVAEHVIVEAHPRIAETARQWAEGRPGNIQIVDGFWQNELPKIGNFDAIVFDPHPLTATPRAHYEEIVPIASHHLRRSGCLTYVSLQSAISRDHRKLLFKYFSHVEFAVVKNIDAPSVCSYWKGDTMTIPCARRAC
jgi:guanidinoacetate N-methyltransferase